eukprot:COSAG02_NODE_9103_length_2329_cov_1.855605_2_plen_376_part_00
MADAAASRVPTSILLSGISGERGLNGEYRRSGSFGDRVQFMKPNTRCYIRFIRSRWEVYVSHHPAGTTYFHHQSDARLPPTDGWTPTEYSAPDDLLRVAAAPAEVEALLPPPVAPEPDLILWTNATCPFAQRVRITLLEKGLHFAEMDVDIVGDREHDPAVLARTEEFRKLWRSCVPNAPHRRPSIPLLQHKPSGDAGAVVTLPESATILDYLEDLQQGPPLLPPAASDRAKVRLFRQVFERELGTALHRILGATTGDELFAASEELRQGLTVVEALLGTRSECVMCGAFSQAEVHAAPDLQRLYTLAPYFRPELARCLCPKAANFPEAMAAVAPKLHEWAQAVRGRPSVASTFDSAAVIALKRRAVARYKGEQR